MVGWAKVSHSPFLWGPLCEVTQRFQLSVLHYLKLPVVGIYSTLSGERSRQAVLWSLNTNPAREALVSHGQEHGIRSCAARCIRWQLEESCYAAETANAKTQHKTPTLWGIELSLPGNGTAFPNDNRNEKCHFNKVDTARDTVTLSFFPCIIIIFFF